MNTEKLQQHNSERSADIGAKPIVSGSKVLMYEKDFKIEQSRMIVEHFIWNCPHCGKGNRTLEFGIHDNKLRCDDCKKETSYAWR